MVRLQSSELEDEMRTSPVGRRCLLALTLMHSAIVVAAVMTVALL